MQFFPIFKPLIFFILANDNFCVCLKESEKHTRRNKREMMRLWLCAFFAFIMKIAKKWIVFCCLHYKRWKKDNFFFFSFFSCADLYWKDEAAIWKINTTGIQVIFAALSKEKFYSVWLFFSFINLNFCQMWKKSQTSFLDLSWTFFLLISMANGLRIINYPRSPLEKKKGKM